MFKTIERVSGGGGGGGFLSDHPSPKDRYARISQEAQSLRVTNPIKVTRDFERIQARLRGQPHAQSTDRIARSGQRYPSDGDGNDREASNATLGRVSQPSSRTRDYSVLGALRVSIPENWVQVGEGESVWFAPEGGYGNNQGQAVFTHGINFGVSAAQGSLQQTMSQITNSWLQNNRDMRQVGRTEGTNVGRRYWMIARFSNRNEATGGTEEVTLLASQLRDGNVLFVTEVLPQNETSQFQSALQRIMSSLQINE